jgi:molecular chaperone GrpE
VATEDKSQPELNPEDAYKTQEQAAQEQESAAGQSQPPVEDLQAQIGDLKNELAQTKEQVLRAHADAQNARRRAEQDVEKAHKFGLEKFVNDILPVADNLERAIEAAKSESADMKTVVEGVELTLKSLKDGLSRHKVEQIHPEGEPFDPQLHQAMSIQEHPDVEPNTVVNVFQPGYTLHGRLVRPAMVVVAKAPAQGKPEGQ